MSADRQVDANIIGSVPLPTNAAQETGGHLAAIDTSGAASKTDLDTIAANTPPLGQALMLLSSPVVIASDQTTIFDRDQRRINEMKFIEAFDLANAAFVTRSWERRSITDRRGSVGRGSTR